VAEVKTYLADPVMHLLADSKADTAEPVALQPAAQPSKPPIKPPMTGKDVLVWILAALVVVGLLWLASRKR
jgi:hypothetical protein